jgi:hypothetical protein
VLHKQRKDITDGLVASLGALRRLGERLTTGRRRGQLLRRSRLANTRLAFERSGGVKARVALYEDPGGQLIIRREGIRMAFMVPDSPPRELLRDRGAAVRRGDRALGRGKAWLERGCRAVGQPSEGSRPAAAD